MQIYDNETLEGKALIDDFLDECQFEECTFINCTLINTKITRCKFVDCKFKNCKFSNVQSNYSTLLNTTFTGCSLQGINFEAWTTNAVFSTPIQEISDCVLRYCTFAEMKLSKMNYSSCSFCESLFVDCDLRESNFRSSKMAGTSFLRCDLQNADFRDANGYNIDIQSNKLKKAKFSFPDVVDLLNGLEIIIE